MNVEDTLHEINWNFPGTMFGENAKLAIFDQLFLTVGNGYRWVDGELVNACPVEKNSFNAFIGDIFWWYNLKSFFVVRSGMWDKEGAWDEEKEIEETIEHCSRPLITFYCASKKYSKCFNVPNDIKQDWLEAVISFLEAATKMDDRYWIDERYAETNDYTRDLSYNSKSKCIKQLAHLKEHFKDRL